MLPIIVEAAVRSLMLAAAVWLGLKLLRIANPHIELAAWQGVLIAALLMPFLVGFAALRLPAATLPIHYVFPADPALLLAPAADPDAADAAAALPRVVPHHLSQLLFQALPDTVAARLDWRVAGLAIYLAVTALLLLRLAVGAAYGLRLCRTATPLRDASTAGHDVRVSTAIKVPVTFGPAILLPANHAGWDAMQRRAVMAHETAHVRHGDCYFLLLAALHRAVFWFSPLSWWLGRRIAYLAEARCDAAAIEDIEDRVRYAEILLGFGAGASRMTAVLAMAGTRTVGSRIERILAETILPKRMDRKAWSGLAACLVPLALVAAGAVAQAPPAQSPAEPAPVPAAQNQQARTIPDPATLRQRQAEQKNPRQEIQIDPALLDNYVGYYEFTPYRIIAVTRQDDHLFVKFTGQDAFQVYPESPQKFFYKDFPSQISFVADPPGRVTGLILHREGLERPAMRIDQAQAQSIEASFGRRIKENTALPGTEDALRHQIEAFVQGKPDFDEMTEGLAAITRPQVPRISRTLSLLGPLQSLSFRGVGIQGWDLYEAKFENGIVICRILLAPDAKISGLRFEWGP